MSLTGFQPVCVLYKGNNSPFDGSCQLVCTHQILEEHFSQGDTVQVTNSSARGQQNGDGFSEKKRAIVMGNEMVSSLIGTLFNAQIPQEESGFLQQILATVKDIKMEVMRQGMEISHIKKRQSQLDGQMATLRDAVLKNLRVKETGGRSNQNSRPASTQEAVKGVPMIVSVVSTTGADGTVVETANCEIEVVEPSPSSPFACMTQDEDSEEEPVLDNVNTVQSPAAVPGSASSRSLPSLVMDTHKGYLGDIMNKVSTANLVEFGTSSFHIDVPISEVEDMVYKTNNAASFAYRLAGKCFTPQEMREGNTRGSGTRSDGSTFNQLNEDAIDMIISEVSKRFPHIAKDSVLRRCVKNAINERCRNERKRSARTDRIELYRTQQSNGRLY